MTKPDCLKDGHQAVDDGRLVCMHCDQLLCPECGRTDEEHTPNEREWCIGAIHYDPYERESYP